jgi:hypothetical protein
MIQGTFPLLEKQIHRIKIKKHQLNRRAFSDNSVRSKSLLLSVQSYPYSNDHQVTQAPILKCAIRHGAFDDKW